MKLHVTQSVVILKPLEFLHDVDQAGGAAS
jgi:hypothetical protein